MQTRREAIKELLAGAGLNAIGGGPDLDPTLYDDTVRASLSAPDPESTRAFDQMWETRNTAVGNAAEAMKSQYGEALAILQLQDQAEWEKWKAEQLAGRSGGGGGGFGGGGGGGRSDDPAPVYTPTAPDYGWIRDLFDDDYKPPPSPSGGSSPAPRITPRPAPYSGTPQAVFRR